MRWTDASSDPNSREALDYREKQLMLRDLRGVTRREFFHQITSGKRVCELGCVDHDFDNRQEDWWMHGLLREKAAHVVGVDYDAEGVRKMRAAGFDAVHADLTGDISHIQALGPFDVVVAGDIIEHVDRPQAILDAGKLLLAPGGQLLVTTPNPYAPWRVRNALAGRVWENTDHITHAFPSGMAELADRAGMTLDWYSSLNTSGETFLLRLSVKDWLRHRIKGRYLRPVWPSPLDVLLARLRPSAMKYETAVYALSNNR